MEPISPKANKGTNHGGRRRQLLRPWLEAQVNSGDYPGLHWVNQERGIFTMKWKHSGRADWVEEDSLIFKAWAKHSGRFREAIDPPDYPTWKTRFRCAMNKQSDVQEVKELSSNDEAKPFRVYQFIKKGESGSNSPTESPNTTLSVSDSDIFIPPQRPSVIQTHAGNIPTTVSESFDIKPVFCRPEDIFDAQMNSLDSDLKNVNIQDLLPAGDMSFADISVDSNINSYNEVMDTDSLKGAGGQQLCQKIKMEPIETPDPLYFPNAITDHEMVVTVRFRKEIIQQHKVTSHHGCRVFYGDVPYDAAWYPELFGSREAEQILVKYTPGQLLSQQDKYTDIVLKGLELGINLLMDKRNIYIDRRCKTRIITAPVNQREKVTKKVERNRREKVFDFTEDFLPAFLQYQQGEGPRPSPQVVIAIGQDLHVDTEPYSDLFVSVTVCHAQASYLLSQHTDNTSVPDLSHSSHFDHIMEVLKDRQETIPLVSNMGQVAASQPVYGGSTLPTV